jgi:hypothetical protein
MGRCPAGAGNWLGPTACWPSPTPTLAPAARERAQAAHRRKPIAFPGAGWEDWRTGTAGVLNRPACPP